MAGDGPEGRRANAEKVRDALESLPALIPQIRSLDVGFDLGETSGNWDVLLVADFATREDLAAYRVHPEHVKVAELINTVRVGHMCVDHEL